MSAERKITLGCIHGNGLDGESWKQAQNVWEPVANTIAPDLPTDRVYATYADYTIDAFEEIEKYADDIGANHEEPLEISLVGHSMGSNVIPRLALMFSAFNSIVKVKNLIHVAGSLRVSTIGRAALRNLPPRNPKGFLDGIVKNGRGLHEFTDEMVDERFFHDCPPNIRRWAENEQDYFKAHKRTEDQPHIDVDSLKRLDIPQFFVVCEEDRVVEPEFQEKVAERAGMKIVRINSGHMPMWSQRQLFAEKIIEIVSKE